MTPEPSETPLVSVILPVRDRAESVVRAIRSVLAQDYRPLQLIVIDDGSRDATLREVAAFGAAVQLIEQAPAGAYAARNAGVRAARGRLIAFIDSDDAWLPGKLTRQLPLFADPAVGLVYGDVAHVASARDDAPRTGRTSFAVAPPPRLAGQALAALSERNFVPTSTVVVRRACLDEIGGFSECTARSADYLAWFRIAQRHRLACVAAPVADYTVHAGGISFDLGRSLTDRMTLFDREREETTDTAVRAVLDRLLANLAISLVLAKLRGRAKSVSIAPARKLLSRRLPGAIWDDLWYFAQSRITGQWRT